MTTVLIVTAMVILPLVMISASLVKEASNFYARVQSGEFNLTLYVQQIFEVLPAWARSVLDRFSLSDLTAARESLTAGLMKGGQALAPQALSIGLNTFDFMVGLGVMLYLLFFLLRDGRALAELCVPKT